MTFKLYGLYYQRWPYNLTASNTRDDVTSNFTASNTRDDRAALRLRGAMLEAQIVIPFRDESLRVLINDQTSGRVYRSPKERDALC